MSKRKRDSERQHVQGANKKSETQPTLPTIPEHSHQELSNSLKKHTPGKRKPDPSFFITILALLVSILIAVVQSNGLELNWKWSAFVYVLLTGGVVWTFLAHASPHKGRTYRGMLSTVIVLVIMCLGAFCTHLQYVKEHTPRPDNRDTNSLTLSHFSDFEQALFSSSNQVLRETSETLFKDENVKLEKEAEQMTNQHELLETTNVTLSGLRKERDLELAMKENEKTRLENQQKIDEIENQKRAEAEKQAQANTQQMEKKQMLDKTGQYTDMTVPIFDYAIRSLDRMLEELAKEASQKRFTDFRGPAPTAYTSRFMKNGSLSRGWNFIAIGTNAAWHFQIGMLGTAVARTSYDYTFASLKIRSTTTNGDSIVSISTHVTFVGNPRGGGQPAVSEVAVECRTPSGLNSAKRVSVTNYTADIDNALRHLLAAQDQQCRLQ